MDDRRGTYLTYLILIFAAAISFATLLLILSPSLERSLGYLPVWFDPFLMIFLLLRLIALFAIWNWRRWGVYAFFLLECLEVALGLFVFTGVFTFTVRFIVAVPSFLILLAIWYFALKAKWKQFI